jgi:hypothetical protein
MGTRAARWSELFPYRDGRVTVQRFTNGWRVELGRKSAQASTVVGAFEALLGRPARDAELDVVLAALARDRARQSK